MEDNEPELDEIEVREDGYTSCANPGRYGCGSCDACLDWADEEAHRRMDDDYWEDRDDR